MLLVAFGVLALITVPLAGGHLWRLSEIRLRHQWLVGVALAAQILFITILPGHLDGIHAPAHLMTYGLAAAFMWANRAIPGVWLIGLGAAANFTVIAANGGVMPASGQALAAAGLVADHGEEFANSAVVEGARLAFLGDVLSVPASWPLSNVFSIGDLVIGTGLLVSLHVICESRLVPSTPDRLRALVAQPHFVRLWAAQATSSIGDFVYALAVAVTVIDQDKGVALLATVLIAQAAPAAITGLLGAPLIDRLSRRGLMVGADLCRALAVGSLLLSSSPSSLHILLVAGCLGTFGALFQPALYASLPNLVAPKLLLTANAAISATFHLSVLIGPLLGGLIATYSGVQAAFAINAATFMASAVLLAGVPIPRTATLAGDSGGLRALRTGLRHVVGTALVRGIAIISGLAMFAAAMRHPLEPMFIISDLGGVIASVGLAAAAWGLGMLAGSCAVPLLERRCSCVKLMGAGLAAMGVATLAASQVGAVGALCLLWLMGGWGNALLTIAYDTLLQERTPDSLRGRVVAANEAVLDAALVAGLALAGGAAAALGVRGVMATSGALLLLAAVMVPLLLRTRSVEQSDAAPVAGHAVATSPGLTA